MALFGAERRKTQMVIEVDDKLAVQVLNSSLSHIKWRLKAAAKRRLQIDILALCTEMRPVIMVDYGGKMPELQERLCELVKCCQKESLIFEQLKVMVIEDMIYLIHVRGISEHVWKSLNAESKVLFVDLEQDPPKMIAQEEDSSIGAEFKLVQKLFASAFPLDEKNNDALSCHVTGYMDNSESSIGGPCASSSCEYIDFSNCLENHHVTIPTLNGWLLGYPVVYLFSKEHISDAICNLSTKSLQIFKVLVSRTGASCKGGEQEELMSFSVPYDLSMGGNDEPWAKEFLAHLQSKWERCKRNWQSVNMEASACYPQAIAF